MGLITVTICTDITYLPRSKNSPTCIDCFHLDSNRAGSCSLLFTVSDWQLRSTDRCQELKSATQTPVPHPTTQLQATSSTRSYISPSFHQIQDVPINLKTHLKCQESTRHFRRLPTVCNHTQHHYNDSY